MSHSIQRLSNCSAGEREAIVNDGQAITIGSGNAADLRLQLTFGMPGACLKVWNERGTLIFENMTRDPGLIFLNGGPLSSIMPLENGDLLQIGNDQFAVVLNSDSPPVEEVPVVEAIPVAIEPTISHVLETVRLNTAVARHTPVDPA